MRRYRFFLLFLLTSTILSSLPAIGAVKAGASCPRAGKVAVKSGNEFRCVKKGKKLVWVKSSKEVAAPVPSVSLTPSPSPTPSPTPTPSIAPSASPTPSPTPNLSNPRLTGYTLQEFVLTLDIFVQSDAQGAFVEIQELKKDRSNTSTLKDSDGRVKISFSVPEFPEVDQYRVFLYTFNEDRQSQCCNSVNIDAGGPPRGDQPTRPKDGRKVSSYREPPVINSKPVSVLSPTTSFQDLAQCKLVDGDPQLTNMTVGFPVPAGRVDFTKKAVIQILPVSFPDVPSSSNPLDDYKEGIGTMKKFWETQSYVGTSIEVRSPTKYKQLPNPVLSYELNSDLNGFQGQKYASFIRYVIGQYESEIDFTGTSTVVVVVPTSVTRQQIGTWVVDTQNTFVTNEGNIYNYMITGNGDSKTQDSAWVHEYGHALGLTDMRFVDPITPTIQRPEGLGVFDIMGSGNAAPETLVWSRFLINVLAPGQVVCITSNGTSTHWLRPLPQRDTGLKGIIIPTGLYTALVVESRRSYGFDSYLSTRDEGALVYRVDTRIPYKRSPMQIIQPSRSQDKEWYTDSALRLNEFVVADGWKITVIERGEFGDVVRVERA